MSKQAKQACSINRPEMLRTVSQLQAAYLERYRNITVGPKASERAADEDLDALMEFFLSLQKQIN